MKLAGRLFSAFALLCLAAYAHSLTSPDRQVTVSIETVGKGPKANESCIKFLSATGHFLLKKSYASEDGEHGYQITKGQWSSDSRYFVFCLASSGGHQPWHSPTSVYSVADNRIYSIDDLYGPVTSNEFRFLSPDTIETSILSGQGTSEAKVVVALSGLARRNKQAPPN